MDEIKTSPKQSHNVKIQVADGRILETEIISFAKYASKSYAGVTCLEMRVENVGNFHKESHNYFDALIALREELEPLQIKVLCFGARKDVWASGMQRDMGAGLMAYLLSANGEGRKPEQSIFDFAPPEVVGSVSEQREFADGWLRKKAHKNSDRR
jgi:hypothetical protein